MCEHCDTVDGSTWHQRNKTEPITCIDEGEFMKVVPETRILVAFDPKYRRSPYGAKINYCPMCGREL